MNSRKKISVIGIGNLLMGDDGVGIRVIEVLKQEELPSNVSVFDGATRAFDVLEYMEGRDKAVIVDAFKKNGPPGSIYRFSFDPEIGIPDESLNLSMHDINFLDALKVSKGIYKIPPEIVIIGIEPEILEFSYELSSKLKIAIPRIINKVKLEF